MLPSRFLAQVAVSFVLVLRANAETHIIKFQNQCGFGTPALMQNGVNILTSDSYQSNGPWSGIAYLQTGYCNTNGENCTLLETTVINPTCSGCGSSTDLSLIPPHAYSVETSFAYYDGCDGQGKTCSNADCTDAAFFSSNDNQVQVACQTNDVNLLVAFCADASQIVLGGGVTNATTGSTSSPASSLPTTTSSLPTSSLPPMSNTPSSGSSTPGSVPPVTPSTASTPPTTTPTQTSTDDTGCGETEPTTPSSTPTPSEPATSAPTSTPASSPTSTPTPTPTIPASSVPPPASASASVSPMTTQNCQPRPTSLTPSNSAPTSPTSAPTFTPSTTPSATPSTSMPSAQLRRHRRTHRIRY